MLRLLAPFALAWSVHAFAPGLNAGLLPKCCQTVPGRPVSRRPPVAMSAVQQDEKRVQMGTLEVSPMGIGTLNWPLNKEEDAGAQESLRACLDAGINFVDTAEAYGFGKSEKLTRNCVLGVGEPVVVATKFAPVPWRREPKDVLQACRASADRLGVDSIDLYQIHWPDIIQPLKALGVEEIKDQTYWDGIAECYQQGLIRNVGVSNYGPALLEQAHAALAERGVPIASNQINFSLLYRKSGAQATVYKCRELGVQPIGYFPLANGLLAGRYDQKGPPKGLKGLTLKKYLEGGVTKGGVSYPEGGITPLMEEMRRVAAGRSRTVAQVAINYVICKGVIPIPGCRNAAMAADNAGAMGWRLTPEEVTSLEAAADALGFEFSGGGFKLE